MTKQITKEPELALVFATISREHTTQRLINSVRKHFPDMPIYIGDQSGKSAVMEEFYRRNNCTVIWMEHDAGVCASRNAALDKVRGPYFVLCDDDFIFGDNTSFEAPLKILKAKPEIGVVGGRLYDVFLANGKEYRANRHWELLFHYDEQKQKLLTLPVHYFLPDPKYVGSEAYYECDAVMNFAVFRTAMFNEKIRWDPIFKSNGEHEDFYLNLKLNSDFKVAYTPKLVAYHHHPTSLQKYKKLRHRNYGWQLFLEKWNLKQFLEMDGTLRVINDANSCHSYAMGYENYYKNPNLVPGEAFESEDRIVISNLTGRLASSRTMGEFADPEMDREEQLSVKVSHESSFLATGGDWRFSLPFFKKKPKKKYLQDDSLLEFEVIVPETLQDSLESFMRIRPFVAGMTDEAIFFKEDDELDVRVSWSIKSGYLTYQRKALIFEQELLLGNWNSIAINPPEFEGDMTMETTIYKNGTVMFEHSMQLAI